ncbi:uncharacterized protein JCM10292_000872 [Rhodotorula paludigena]|uniref:uncharacterized protein n=1 Tax=Rhodotorula paludigena TaxID=86838 RepID=UPI00317779E9
MRAPFSLLLCTLFALLLAAVDAKKTGKVLTTNEKAAASLQAAAVKLKPGNYRFQNVQTKQSFVYQAKGNHVYPGKTNKGAAFTVAAHPDSKVAWHRLAVGGKNKCLSSAWGSSGNNAAVAYACAVGNQAKGTKTLEKTKQWWLIVPVSKPTAKAASNSYANQVLLAAQADSIKTRERKIAAQKAAFGKRSLELDSDVGHERMARMHRRAILEKRASIKTVSGGTFYVIAVDHLLDRTAALTGKVIKTRGIKNTVISNWKKGNKAQQWKVTRV